MSAINDVIRLSDKYSPLVSVLMPAYNHEKFVEQAVRSVWSQTYNNIELIAIDDGSSDSTFGILQVLCAESPIEMKVFTQKNKGVCNTLNKCFQLSTGEWVAHLASDDLYDENFIERMLAVSRSHPMNSTVLHCDALIINEQGFIGGRLGKIRGMPPLSGDAFFKIAHGKGFIIPSTMFLSRSLFEKVGPYDPRLHAEDFDIHLRLARIAEFVYLDEPLFFSRKVDGSLGSRRHLWSGDLFVALEKHRDFLGGCYHGAVVSRHKQLAQDFYSDADFRSAFQHLNNAVYNAAGISKKSTTLLQVMLAFASSTPRLIALILIPGSIVGRIRAIKYKLLSSN